MSGIVKTSVFLCCFGGMDSDKPYFNNSNSSVENSNDNEFLTTSLLVKGITLLKVKFFSFFYCFGKIFFLFLHTLLSINRTINYVPINACYYRSNIHFKPFKFFFQFLFLISPFIYHTPK